MDCLGPGGTCSSASLTVAPGLGQAGAPVAERTGGWRIWMKDIPAGIIGGPMRGREPVQASVRFQIQRGSEAGALDGGPEGLDRLGQRTHHDRAPSRSVMRVFTQASISASTQPTARSPIFTGSGNCFF